ncbi:Hsp70 family protein [bacterium]|nr:Hsp70 family protein [bacterium]
MIIGIDLGTTNCAVAWADPRNITDKQTPVELRSFEIPQLTHPGSVELRTLLPSFLYFPGPKDLPANSIELPWDQDINYAVGHLAREQGAKIPHRVISSAKSWLSNENVDRTAPILPWNSSDEVPHISPIEASARYLQHIARAWDQSYPDAPFTEQDIVITVPASFDTVARDFTVQAAKQIGIKNLSLLEEPQAAFYSWLDDSNADWRSQISVGDRILVCDIGGGTTDFSLITVADREGNLSLERSAVGEHLLLGGDNMDLTLAVFLQQKLKTERRQKLDSWQMQVLTHACRSAKEQLLQKYGQEEWSISIPGRGSSLISSSIQTSLHKEEVEKLIVEGFFPKCTVEDQAVRSRQSGLRELGLPFESNPAVTKHLARFLSIHKPEDGSAPFFAPTAILFNGGVLKAAVLRERITETVNSWLAAIGAPALKVLTGGDHDLAVARGAARSGLSRYGLGARIKAGVNRSYYIGIESSMPAIPGLPAPLKALCVANFGMEEDTREAIPNRSFGLTVGEQADFRFFGSTCRRSDKIGDIVEDWEDDIEELLSLQVTLTGDTEGASKIIPVTLESHVTDLGTLEVWCCQNNGSGKWKLEFETRNQAS